MLTGSGRMMLDEEMVEIDPLDAIRVTAGITRSFEAGPDGLDVLAFGPRRDDDRGEMVESTWGD